MARRHNLKIKKLSFHNIKYSLSQIEDCLSSSNPNSFNKRFIENYELQRFNKPPQIKSNCALISGDVHIPFHCPETMAHCIKLCKQWNCKTAVFVGDLVEQDVFKPYIDHLHGLDWPYEKRKFKECMSVFLNVFDEIYWLIGNHELRMWKRLEGRGDTDDFYKIYLTWEKSGKVKTSTYPWAVINDSWFVCHPKSYSNIQGRNTYGLASKYLIELLEKGKSPNGQYGIVGFHGHLGGSGTDVSSRFQVADGMGMFDPDLFEYYKMKITRSPAWRKGFYILKNNYLYSFPEESTDWDWWLKK